MFLRDNRKRLKLMRHICFWSTVMMLIW